MESTLAFGATARNASATTLLASSAACADAPPTSSSMATINNLDIMTSEGCCRDAAVACTHGPAHDAEYCNCRMTGRFAEICVFFRASTRPAAERVTLARARLEFPRIVLARVKKEVTRSSAGGVEALA